MAGELLNPHDHDRGIANEAAIQGHAQLDEERWSAHLRLHEAEADNRKLALDALQSQTRLVFAIFGLVIALAPVVVYMVTR